MGHRWDAMAHPRVTEKQRRAAMGRAMDLNVMSCLIKTIRMHLKTKEVRREIEISERYQEDLEVERRRPLQAIEEQQEARIREGWAFMALECEGAEEQEQEKEGVARAEAMKEKEKERAPEEDWPIGEGMGAKADEELQKVLKQHRQTFAYTLQELGVCKTHVMEIKLTSEIAIY
ncbi:unnamed protein product [Closterium sp. NIES-53]